MHNDKLCSYIAQWDSRELRATHAHLIVRRHRLKHGNRPWRRLKRVMLF